jgi:hypothetical protein
MCCILLSKTFLKSYSKKCKAKAKNVLESVLTQIRGGRGRQEKWGVEFDLG